MCTHFGKKRSLAFISGSNNSINVVKKHKQVRKVRFGVTVTSSERPNYLNQQNQAGEFTSPSDIWYTKQELAVFTNQARDHVLGFGHLSLDKNTRGYERYGIERTKQKNMTRKIILLLMQQKILNDDEKSLIASRSSAWATEEAFARGCMDFCEAYHPQMCCFLQQDAQINDITKNSELGISPSAIFMQQNKKRRFDRPRDNRARAA